MRKLAATVSALMFAAVGCGQSHETASWAFDLVRWHQHTYKITADKANNIGRQIGSVTNYSNDERSAQTGTFSNRFPVGTQLFEITGQKTDTVIAVQGSDGTFLKAVNDEANSTGR